MLKRKPPFFLCCGGVLGVGLVEIVRKAYSFVIFNYDPGDQILSLASLAAHVAHGPSLALYAMSACCDVSTPPALTRRSDLYQRRLVDADGSGGAMCSFRAEYSDSMCTRPEDDAWPAGSIGALSSEASVVDRQPSGAIEQFAIEQLMTAESKEGLQQLFVQHAHNNRPKQGCKGRPQ